MPPVFTVALAGVAVSVKSGTVTLRFTFAVCVSEPLVPLMVRVELLAELPAGIVTVSVELPDVRIEVGENEAMAPDGRPLTEKSTTPVNEPRASTFTAYVALPPGFTEVVLGVAVSV
jgi:hypothetical protein